MATQKQIEANRRNAQKSTGPATETGKAAVKLNALKHGMTAEIAVLPHEDESAYTELRETLVAHYNAVGPVEEMLVETAVNSYWRLLRVRRVETAALRLGIESYKRQNHYKVEPSKKDDDRILSLNLTDEEDRMRKLDRYQVNVERSYYRAVETLRKIQNERLKEERRAAAPSEIGFVSQAKAAGLQPLRPLRTSTKTRPSPAIRTPTFTNAPARMLLSPSCSTLDR